MAIYRTLEDIFVTQPWMTFHDIIEEHQMTFFIDPGIGRTMHKHEKNMAFIMIHQHINIETDGENVTKHSSEYDEQT